MSSQPEPPGDRGITLWGAASTGKTTFLAALSTALIRQERQLRVRAIDDASGRALTKFTTELFTERVFPPATVGPERYRWELCGTVQRPVPRRWIGTRPAEVPVTIPLNLVDAPGESADPVKAGSVLWNSLLDSMVSSRGIVFLFDPVREFESGDAFTHTIGVVNEMSQRMRDRSLPDGRLPHHVAVCVAKFDELRVLETAEKLGMVEYGAGPLGFPRVPDDEAREFFMHLCGVSSSGDADMVPALLERTFRPDRIRYFVTSAIGFYVDTLTGAFDRDDPQNHLPGQETQERSRIRGSVYPINVVEPVMWLASAVAGREVG
jgi:hypothetical protein